MVNEFGTEVGCLPHHQPRITVPNQHDTAAIMRINHVPGLADVSVEASPDVAMCLMDVSVVMSLKDTSAATRLRTGARTGVGACACACACAGVGTGTSARTGVGARART
ncbi:hypothetical protein [Nonomuraea sp. NEAU-A123]|uniref:hypothetical protein n=1 Tax=Nonomuraea sp. NEAU-A123 TaxID=2839649 RepID=UPI001BE49664|nr:hypothetical protein [Nonomuraea sp. NEAU-A123]